VLRTQLQKAELSAERVLHETKCIAFSCITDLFDAEGRLRPLADVPPDVAAALRTHQTRETGDGTRVVIQLWDKVRALELLCRHLGLLKGALQVEGPLEIRWQDAGGAP